MTINRRVFRTPRWASTLIAASFAASLSGAAFSASSSGINTLSIGLSLLAIVFAVGLAEALLSRVRLTPDTLECFSNFHSRVLQRSEVRSVTWAAGCPVVLVLATGGKLRLPPVGDSLKMANSIRAWLNRPDNGSGKDRNAIAEARDVVIPLARRIVSGEIEPYEGAMTIWKQALDKLEGRIPDDLWPFKSNASAIEDCLWDSQDSGTNHDILIAQCKEEIMRAAKMLVGET